MRKSYEKVEIGPGHDFVTRCLKQSKNFADT